MNIPKPPDVVSSTGMNVKAWTKAFCSWQNITSKASIATHNSMSTKACFRPLQNIAVLGCVNLIPRVVWISRPWLDTARRCGCRNAFTNDSTPDSRFRDSKKSHFYWLVLYEFLNRGRNAIYKAKRPLSWIKDTRLNTCVRRPLTDLSIARTFHWSRNWEGLITGWFSSLQVIDCEVHKSQPMLEVCHTPVKAYFNDALHFVWPNLASDITWGPLFFVWHF